MRRTSYGAKELKVTDDAAGLGPGPSRLASQRHALAVSKLGPDDSELRPPTPHEAIPSNSGGLRPAGSRPIGVARPMASAPVAWGPRGRLDSISLDERKS